MLIRVFFYTFFLLSLVITSASFGGNSAKDDIEKHIDSIFSWDSSFCGTKTYKMEMTKKRHDIFFGTDNYDVLRKYRKADFGLFGEDLIKSKFRTRGTSFQHWGRQNKSIKIRFKDHDGNKKSLNLNSLLSDPYLMDLLAYRLYKRERFLVPNMELSELVINGEHNGIKVRLENIDKNFLNRNKIPLGSVFRENHVASLVTFYNWSTSDYWNKWERQTLTKEKNSEDWLSFLRINSIENDEKFFRYIKKVFDIDDFIKWYALTALIEGTSNSDHNLVFINDFRDQRFKQLGYDPQIDFGLTREPTKPISFYVNPFQARILTNPEYFFRINKQIYSFLENDLLQESFLKDLGKCTDTLTAKLKDLDQKGLGAINNPGLISNPLSKLTFNLKIHSINLENDLSGRKAHVDKKPLLLNSKNYQMGSMQKIHIEPQFSKLVQNYKIKGIDLTTIEWDGLPSWLVPDSDSKIISGVVPRVSPENINITLHLKIRDVDHKYKYRLHIKKADQKELGMINNSGLIISSIEYDARKDTENPQKYYIETLRALKTKTLSWYDDRKRYLMKEFENVKVNLNFKNLLPFASQKPVPNKTESANKFELPISNLEIIIKGGSGIRLNKVVFKLPNPLQIYGGLNAQLCHDKNSNKKKDEGEKCIMQDDATERTYISFTNKNNTIPLLLPKLNITPNFSKTKISNIPTLQLKKVATQYNYTLLLGLKKKVAAETLGFNIKIHSIKLENALTGLKAHVNKKPLLLNSKNYQMGPMQKIHIEPQFSKLVEGIDTAIMEWDGLPSWLAPNSDGKIISGVVPRMPPEKTIITLHLKIGDVDHKYKYHLHIKKWDGIANIFSYIDPDWAQFMESANLRLGLKSKSREYFKKLYYRIDALFHVYTNFDSIIKKRGFRIDQSWIDYDILENNKEIIWGPGAVEIEKTLVLPASSSLIIKPGTHIKISEGKAIIFHGVVKAIGKPGNEIVFSSSKPDNNFGSLIFNHWSMPGSKFKDVVIERGKDFLWKERFYSGALSAYNTPLSLIRVVFRNNHGDDAFNAKYSNSTIESSAFYDNAADAIDLDFSGGTIHNSIFVNNGDDAIDVGTSIPIIEGNWIENSGDKAISIGEESKPDINGNVFYMNKVGIAVKDGAFPIIENALFINNKSAFNMYIKKSKYPKPYASMNRGLFISNKSNVKLLNSTHIDVKHLNISNKGKVALGLPIQKIYSIFTNKNLGVSPEDRLDTGKMKKIFNNREIFSKSTSR